MWGVAPSKTEMAEEYAAAGWCALVPNMFWRSEFTGRVPFENADLAWQRLQAFDWQRAVDDARTAVQWLRSSPLCTGKVAAIGFCMGGRTAFLAGARCSVDAAVSLYALGIAKHLDEVRNVAVPTQLHYGLNDEHIPKSEMDAVTEAARGNRNVEVHFYPGAEHGFFTKGRPAWHPEGGGRGQRAHRPIAGDVEVAVIRARRRRELASLAPLLRGEGGERGAIASASRVRGGLAARSARPSPALARLSPPLGHPLPALRGEGKRARRRRYACPGMTSRLTAPSTLPRCAHPRAWSPPGRRSGAPDWRTSGRPPHSETP